MKTPFATEKEIMTDIAHAKNWVPKIRQKHFTILK